MPGIFILSLDCEGKWGASDHINNHHKLHFTNERLNQAYRNILNILKKEEIKGTFAFVGVSLCLLMNTALIVIGSPMFLYRVEIGFLNSTNP